LRKPETAPKKASERKRNPITSFQRDRRGRIT
jgi:hypothetical protein